MFNLKDFKKYKSALRRDGKRVHFVAHIPDAACKTQRLLSIDSDGVLWFTCEDGMYVLSGRSGNDLINAGYIPHKISFTIPEPLATMPEQGDIVHIITGPIWALYVAEVIWDGSMVNIFEKGLVWSTRQEAETALVAFAKGYR